MATYISIPLRIFLLSLIFSGGDFSHMHAQVIDRDIFQYIQQVQQTNNTDRDEDKKDTDTKDTKKENKKDTEIKATTNALIEARIEKKKDEEKKKEEILITPEPKKEQEKEAEIVHAPTATLPKAYYTYSKTFYEHTSTDSFYEPHTLTPQTTRALQGLGGISAVAGMMLSLKRPRTLALRLFSIIP